MKWEDEKRDAWHMVIFICVIWLIFLVADLVKPSREESIMENRILAQLPTLTKESLLSGDFIKEYEAYTQDQFVNRDKWVSIRLNIDALLGVKEVENLYLGDNGYLFKKVLPEAYEPLEEGKLARLSAFLQKFPETKVALIPTKEAIYEDKLPLFAPNYDQASLLEKAYEIVGEDHWIDLYGTLESHKKEKLFFKSDTHLTMQGSMYVYEAWMTRSGYLPRYYTQEDMETILFMFRGNLWSPKAEDVTDQLMAFTGLKGREISVVYDGHSGGVSLVNPTLLSGEYPYDYYLNGKHGYIKINTGYRASGKELIVLKDSYANQVIQFFIPYYRNIYVIDMDLYDRDVDRFIEENKTEKTDILILESVTGFLD